MKTYYLIPTIKIQRHETWDNPVHPYNRVMETTIEFCFLKYFAIFLLSKKVLWSVFDVFEKKIK